MIFVQHFDRNRTSECDSPQIIYEEKEGKKTQPKQETWTWAMKSFEKMIFLFVPLFFIIKLCRKWFLHSLQEIYFHQAEKWEPNHNEICIISTKLNVNDHNQFIKWEKNAKICIFRAIERWLRHCYYCLKCALCNVLSHQGNLLQLWGFELNGRKERFRGWRIIRYSLSLGQCPGCYTIGVNWMQISNRILIHFNGKLYS